MSFMVATCHEAQKSVPRYGDLYRATDQARSVPPLGCGFLRGPKQDCYTSALVWSEARSWFFYRQGENAARTFRTLASSLEGLEILSADLSLHDEAPQMLDRMRGARLTYVDASSLALMARHEIRTAWSTDYDLSLTGAEVVPSP